MKINVSKIKEITLLVFFYFLIFFIFLRGILFSPGIISGGDWGFPLTQSQIWRYFQSGLYVWTDREILGSSQFFLNTLPFQLLIGLLAKIGITGEIYTKLLLILAFVFPAFAMYLLCRFLNCSRMTALFGGFLYFTLPCFFNYAAIGWLFILFSMGILPLSLIFFIRSVKEEKTLYSILTGFSFFLATVQSQSLVWYPLAFLSLVFFLINNKRSLFVYLRSLSVIFFVFLGLSAFWWLSFLLGEKSGALSTGLGLSSVSLGTWARLSNINILRVWGSLFNYQYETSYPSVLTPLSFLLPFLAYSSLFFLKKRRIVYSLVLLSFVPIILFKLGPGFITILPLSDLIRDVARFSVLSSFSYVILASLVLNFMLEHQQKQVKIIGIIFSIFLVINAYPFWAGELFGEQKHDYDNRLRTYKFPPGYFTLENSLREEKTDTKVLYLPITSALQIVDDKRFYGGFNGIRDIFASYSPKPGLIGISDKVERNVASLVSELQEILNKQQIEKLSKLLSLMDVKYLVVRKNVEFLIGVSGKEVAASLSKETPVTIRQEWDKISLFENNNFLPHFYIPQKIIYSSSDIGTLPDIVSFWDYELKSGVYFENLKLENQDILNRADEVFMRANLENGIDKDYFKKKESFKNSASFPYVKHRPGSLWWKLAGLREKYEEWRVRKNPEKLIDKKLFYTGKRISEFEKFGTDGDKAMVRLISEGYRIKMEEAIKGIEKLKISISPEIEKLRALSIIKLRAYWERYKEKIEEIHGGRLRYDENTKEIIKSWGEVFAKLDEKIKVLEKKFDLQNLEYTFEIPKEGEYELFIKTESIDEFLLASVGVEIDNEVIPAKMMELKKGGWLNLGKRDFKEGGHRLILYLPELENLVGDDWQKLKGIQIEEKVVKFLPQGFFIQGENIVFQPINDWRKDTFYYLSFDYKTEDGSLGVGILEDKLGKQEGKEVVKTEKIFERTLRKPPSGLVDGGDWQKFELVINSDFKSLGARIFFWSVSDPNRLANVNFKNLKIYQIVQPKVMLRLKVDKPNISQAPKITFFKINPTKYRVKVERAKEPYTLVFSESFHKRWRAYIADRKNADTDYGQTVASYFDGEIKEGTHRNIFLDRHTFETWGKKPIAEDRHYLVNGYANSWYITPEDSGGKEDYELVVEFQPQKLFYVGLGFSLATLLVCLGYLGYNSAVRILKKRI
ncbi:MAG: hypothetical protein ACOZBZ_02595 [Patescibacteria group bacterium]